MRQQPLAGMALQEDRVVIRQQKVTGPARTEICPGDRLAATDSAPGTGVLPAAPVGGMPDPNTYGGPNGLPLLYFPAARAI
jgi:hypothetical protein